MKSLEVAQATPSTHTSKGTPGAKGRPFGIHDKGHILGFPYNCPYREADSHVLRVATVFSKVDEARLLERARAWDERALMEIYDLYQPGLYRYAYRLLGNPEEAEECVAEVFARFLFALRRGQGPQRHLKAYLYRMVHNWAQDRFRERPTAALEDVRPQRLTSGDPPLDEAVARRWRAERLRQALRQLPPRQAEVLRLRFLQGFSLEEVAEIMETTVGAVKSLQHRGLENLRRMLKEEDL